MDQQGRADPEQVFEVTDAILETGQSLEILKVSQVLAYKSIVLPGMTEGVLKLSTNSEYRGRAERPDYELRRIPS